MEKIVVISKFVVYGDDENKVDANGHKIAGFFVLNESVGEVRPTLSLNVTVSQLNNILRPFAIAPKPAMIAINSFILSSNCLKLSLRKYEAGEEYTRADKTIGVHENAGEQINIDALMPSEALAGYLSGILRSTISSGWANNFGKVPNFGAVKETPEL